MQATFFIQWETVKSQSWQQTGITRCVNYSKVNRVLFIQDHTTGTLFLVDIGA